MGIFRNPKTTQERRINGSRCQWLLIDEYQIKCKPSRSLKNLPESWDDVIRSDWNSRNWKNYRKTQYKTE